MIKEMSSTFFALLILGLAAAAVAVGWKWGNNQGLIK